MRHNCTEVHPGVFVGGWTAAEGGPGKEFSLIINCAADAPDFGSVERYPLIDGPGNPASLMEAAISGAVDAIGLAPTLIHCVSGKSRSVVVASAAIAKRTLEPFDVVLERVRVMRSCDSNQPHPALIALAKGEL